MESRKAFHFLYTDRGRARVKKEENSRKPRNPLRSNRRRYRRISGFDPVLLVEPFDPSGCIHQLLLAGEERMTTGADFDLHIPPGGVGFERVAAGTIDLGRLIVRMNALFHSFIS